MFLWEVASQQVVTKFSGHNGKVNAVSFNEEETVLASGSADMSVRLWDLKSVALPARERDKGAHSELTSLLVNRSQQRLPLMVLEDGRDSITSLLIRGSTLIAGSVDGHVRTYDLRQGELRTDFFDRKSHCYIHH